MLSQQRAASAARSASSGTARRDDGHGHALRRLRSATGCGGKAAGRVVPRRADVHRRELSVKAGAQRVAAELGLILIAPDTSPRGEGVPDDPDGAYDFGLGASFYLDAAREPWVRHYRMESYIMRELPEIVAGTLPADMERQGIMGHSMGGHGALTLALRHPGQFASISAFAPIAFTDELPLGREGAGRLPWPRPGSVARP
ncbi:MAG: S-formylglutathione hydrolase [Bryobacterales bacterium]|jgi:S-formylglutathione hydrolase FrmB|nr:S-formylglutathione hydrolase [Bryobacterales bacterium]